MWELREHRWAVGDYAAAIWLAPGNAVAHYKHRHPEAVPGEHVFHPSGDVPRAGVRGVHHLVPVVPVADDEDEVV